MGKEDEWISSVRELVNTLSEFGKAVMLTDGDISRDIFESPVDDQFNE